MRKDVDDTPGERRRVQGKTQHQSATFVSIPALPSATSSGPRGQTQGDAAQAISQ